MAAKTIKPTIYLIPGQGSDERIFNNMEFDDGYTIHYIHHSLPGKNMDMAAYARQLAKQIDTTETFILIGVSLGGMLAVEMNEFLHPEMTILLSSAKTAKELPLRYRFQKVIPFYALISPSLAKLGARALQPLVEPDRKHEKATYKAMIKAKDPLFLKRTISMIINWDKADYSGNIIHIHGDNDHTIPIRHVAYDYRLNDGSHMMTLTRGDTISALVASLLNDSFSALVE